MKRYLVVYCDRCDNKVETYRPGQERTDSGKQGWSYELAPGHHTVDLCPRCNGRKTSGPT